MSIVQLLLDASAVVQIVIFILLLLSIISWSIIGYKFYAIYNCYTKVKAFKRQFWSGINLYDLFIQLESSIDKKFGLGNVFFLGFTEYIKLKKKNVTDEKIITPHVNRVMRVAVSNEEVILIQNLSFLASIGSISPYIGLFGTVWGIMHAFLGLSFTENVSLAVVAPGIAEALIATAMGIFVAIPSVLFYNIFTAYIDSLIVDYDKFAEELSGILAHSLY